MSSSNDYTATLSLTSMAAIQVALEAEERVAKRAIEHLIQEGKDPEHPVRAIVQQHLDNVRQALEQVGEAEPA